jgi:hypothetical protein
MIPQLLLNFETFVVHQKKTNEREEAKGADDDNAERTAFVHGSYPRFPSTTGISRPLRHFSRNREYFWANSSKVLRKLLSTDPFLNVKHCLDFSFVFSAPLPA